MKKIKCWDCGADATKARKKQTYFAAWHDPYDPNSHTVEPSKFTRNYCDACYEKRMNKLKEDDATFKRIKRDRMFERAVGFLEGGKVAMEVYREPIAVVREFMEEHPTKFDSADEVLAAIILMKNRIPTKVQYKIEEYTVDFLLPDDQIILEIDGDRHKMTREKDQIRDNAIKAIMPGWSVIRIPAEELEKNPEKLIIAMEKVLDYRSAKKEAWSKK